MYPLIIAFQLRTPAAPARMRVMSRQRSSQFLPDPVTDAFYQEKVKGLMSFCTGVLVFVSFSLLSSTRSSVTIRVLITPIPLPIVLVDRLLVLPPRTCPANPAELRSTYGTQGPHRARNKPHEHLPQAFEYDIRRRAVETAECGDYDRQRARSSANNSCACVHRD